MSIPFSNEERFFNMLKKNLLKLGYILDRKYFDDVCVSIRNKLISIEGSNDLRIIHSRFMDALSSIDDPFEDQFMSAVEAIKVILEKKEEKDLAADQILTIIKGLLPAAPAGGARRTKRRKASKRKTRSKRSRRSR